MLSSMPPVDWVLAWIWRVQEGLEFRQPVRAAYLQSHLASFGWKSV